MKHDQSLFTASDNLII